MQQFTYKTQNYFVRKIAGYTQEIPPILYSVMIASTVVRVWNDSGCLVVIVLDLLKSTFILHAMGREIENKHTCHGERKSKNLCPMVDVWPSPLKASLPNSVQKLLCLLQMHWWLWQTLCKEIHTITQPCFSIIDGSHSFVSVIQESH